VEVTLHPTHKGETGTCVGTYIPARSSRNPERCFAGLIVAINMCLANSAEFKASHLHTLTCEFFFYYFRVP
jgi:hypothetical protein